MSDLRIDPEHGYLGTVFSSVHIGRSVHTILEHNSISLEEASARGHIDIVDLSQLIEGKSSLEVVMALRVSILTGSKKTVAKCLMRSQQFMRLSRIRDQLKEHRGRIHSFDIVPYKEGFTADTDLLSGDQSTSLFRVITYIQCDIEDIAARLGEDKELFEKVIRDDAPFPLEWYWFLGMLFPTIAHDVCSAAELLIFHQSDRCVDIAYADNEHELRRITPACMNKPSNVRYLEDMRKHFPALFWDEKKIIEDDSVDW